MKELVPLVGEFKDKPIVFISLSIAGWHSGELPSTKFLTEWKEKHHLPFTAAASPKNPGREFYDDPHIPNTVIIDKNGNLAFKQEAPGAEGIVEAVRRIAQ